MKRDAPIPWSVSLPCVAAIVALVIGWRLLAPRAPAVAESKAIEAPSIEASALEIAPDSPAKSPATSPTPLPSAVPAPQLAPVSTPASPLPAVRWLALSKLTADDLPDHERPLAVAAAVASHALLRLRDRLGPRAAEFVVRREPAAAVLIVLAADVKPERREAIGRALVAFGERLDQLVLAPAGLGAAPRTWVALSIHQEDEERDTADANGFDGVVGRGDDTPSLVAIALRQLRGALARGPSQEPLDWVVAGAAGVAAHESLADALAAADPLPSLAALVASRPEGDVVNVSAFARAATSFAAFCLARGPKDAKAAGFFDLLKLDGRSLPVADEARDAEIAARLGATRLLELESAWRAARE